MISIELSVAIAKNHLFSGGAAGLVKAILQLAQSDSLRQAIATQARQRIWAEHSVAAISTKLEKLLTSLIPS